MKMAVEGEGIFTEAQLAAAIESEQWYDSDGDGHSETDDKDWDLETGSTHTRTRDGTNDKNEWTSLLWNSGDQLTDDPSFPTLKSSNNLDIESILQRLNLDTESVDLGEEENAISESDSQLHRGKGEEEPNNTQEVCTSKGTRGVSQERDEKVEHTLEDVEERNEPLPSADLSPSVSTTADSTAGSSERPKYYCIAHEIMTTERTYVQNLRLLEKVVHGAIKTAHMTRRTILPEQGRKEIFLNIGEIYALNFDLLQELEERIENWDSYPMIADVLAKRAPFFKLYSMYSARFDSAQVAYCKWIKSSKSFANLISMIETGPLCKGLPVSSYMLCPVQRVPRYRLLLEDYLRHLPEGHPDIENTKAALAAISEAADHMNDRISDLENQAKVVQMQKTFVGKENIVAPGRKYLGRGPVYFVPGSRRKQRVLFLFSDILLIAGITAHGRYRVHHKMPLKKMLVSVVQSPVLQNAFCIAERGLPRPLRFCTKSLEERNKWIKELNKAKSKDDGAFVTLSKNSPYASVLNDPEAHSSILAVLNDPSFEHSHPSWVRRSIRLSSSARMALPFTSYALAAAHSASGEGGVGVEEVDFGEEVVTEFESDQEKKNNTKMLKAGMDNTLSCYMRQLSVSQVWRKRWFVLTSKTLVCYEDHTHDVANGALSLEGYRITAPETEEDVLNTFKLIHSSKLMRTYYFQLPTTYDYERWFGTLQELLYCGANST